jgi:hypothetical protein
MWYDRTAGTNIALGKQASYLPILDWSYCVDANDPWQLTDGAILFTTHDGLTDIERVNKLRFSAEAVGWNNTESPAHIIIDLEQVYAVRRVVVRYQGGIPGTFDFPVSIELAVSEDGVNYYRVGEYLNVSGTSDGPFMQFRMPHFGDYAVIFPYAFGELTTKARYVGLEIAPRRGAFLDEIAVIQGDFDPATVEYDEQDRYAFPTTAAAVIPRGRKLYVPNNVTTYQNVSAYNDLSSQGTDVSWVVELPPGVQLSDQVHLKDPKPDFRTAQDELYMPFYDQVTQINRGGETYTRYVFKYGGPYDFGPEGGRTYRVGPLFFVSSLPAGPAGDGYIYAQWDGGQQAPEALPIEVYSMPAAAVPQRLHVSMGWMGDYCTVPWPDYVNNYRALGFNVHPVFPRYWDRGIAGYDGSQALMESARAAGLKIVYNESPWFGWLQPAQRDAAYYAELQRLHDRAALTNPDWIFYDVEHLPAVDYQDPDFVARMLAEGLDPADPADQQEMLRILGAEVYGDMYDAVVSGMTGAGYPAGEAAGRPLCGSFQLYAGGGLYYWLDYSRFYPDSLQYSMPAYYLAGDAELVGKKLVNVRKAQGSSDIIPWLSPGCYGEFPSEWMRDQALESFLSGCRGITYYSSTYMDGLDFYSHLEAVNIASKIEDIIVDGTPIGRGNLGCVGQRLPVKGLELPNGEAAILIARYRDLQEVPAPSFTSPGPGLQVPFTTGLSPVTYGLLSSSGGTWTFADGVGTAADVNTTVRFYTTTDDGTVTAMPTNADWVTEIVYREDVSGSGQQFLKLGPAIGEMYISSSAKLILDPEGFLTSVPKTADNWHTLTFHYHAANGSFDMYLDGSLRFTDFVTWGGHYTPLGYVELRGPVSLADIAVGIVDAQAGECPGGSPDDICVQLKCERTELSDVVDLDTGTFLSTIAPGSSIFKANMDRTTKVFYVRRTLLADFNHDSDVDGDDLSVFTSCISGPMIQPAGTATCRQADFDEDNDVDQSDFGLFQRCFSGPGNRADIHCLD